MVSFGCTSKEDVSLLYLLFQEKNSFLAGKIAAYRCSTFRQIQYRSLTICNNCIKRENEHSKYL